MLTVTDEAFGLAIPTVVPNCPADVLIPRNTWQDTTAYDETATNLRQLLNENFAEYANPFDDEIISTRRDVA